RATRRLSAERADGDDVRTCWEIAESIGAALVGHGNARWLLHGDASAEQWSASLNGRHSAAHAGAGLRSSRAREGEGERDGRRGTGDRERHSEGVSRK